MLFFFIMAAEGGNNIVRRRRRFTYTGADGEVIPDEATHVKVHTDTTFVRARAFLQHPNIVQVICHDRVEKIEEGAFCWCPSLIRVIMPGVKVLERSAFDWCKKLNYVDCGKLEVIEEGAFNGCKRLRSIKLPSARIVGGAFRNCKTLREVKFGNKLERIFDHEFCHCRSLDRITIPLKNGLFDGDKDGDIFDFCTKLKHVDLVEGELHETVAALQLEEWRSDMNKEIDSINRILPNKHNTFAYKKDWLVGAKAEAIRTWIGSVLRKINHYKKEHQRVLDDAASILQFVLPHDIATNNVLCFLELPSHTFEEGTTN